IVGACRHHILGAQSMPSRERFAVLVCMAVLTGATRAQRGNDPAALDAELARLYQAGKYAEAAEIAKRSLAIMEMVLGPGHPAVGTSLNNLAGLYWRQGRFATNNIHLGAQATEREIKQLSANGEPAKYRMVHFATHDVLAGQLDGTHEPGLILTPPDKATEEDDGYLSASEIDPVGLQHRSRCCIKRRSTIGPGAGLFLRPGPSALLVSHWEVYSDATVKLITTAIREMAR